MGLFGWLFGSSKPADPPTEKQIDYARKLGITIPADATKASLSDLITEAEQLRGKRKQRRKHGQDVIDEESRWQVLADAEKWMLVVFANGQSKVAEVVRINGASISDGGKVVIEAEAIQITNDRDAGKLVDVGRYLEIRADKIEWHEIIDEIDIMDVRGFKMQYDRVKSRA